MPQVEERRFYRDLASLMTKSPILGHACVIDRAGYQARYDAKYGSERWRLCKTAFSVLVERAAKFADARGCRLRIFVEYSDRTSDRRIKEYYKDMKANGLPFSSDTSSRYNPLSKEQLSFILLDLQFKDKKHPLLQMADLALYPMCKDKYGFYQPMRDLVKHKRVIDAVLAPAEQDTLGIKYSCFDPAGQPPCGDLTGSA